MYRGRHVNPTQTPADARETTPRNRHIPNEKASRRENTRVSSISLHEAVTTRPAAAARGKSNETPGRRRPERSPNLALRPAKKRYNALPVGDDLEEGGPEVEGARDARLNRHYH